MSEVARPPLSMEERLSGTKGKNILWVDLTQCEFGQGDVVHYSAPEVLQLMNVLKQFVEADSQKVPSERIDSVQWDVQYGNEPTREMWEILNGLSPPKHLKLFAAGVDEACNVDPLKTFQHQWNDLDTLTLVDICERDVMERLPNMFSAISSLTLDLCFGVDFIPPTATCLKHVCILQNNPCSMIAYAVNHHPFFVQGLEALEIETTNCDFQCYDAEPQDFRDRLRKCTNLREFQFAAGYVHSMDTDLASYIPSSVEKLTLRFTRSLLFLHNFDDWIKHASDRTWLPHLKSFQLTIDKDSSVGGLEGENLGPFERSTWTRKLKNPPREFAPEAFDMEFEGKRAVLYDVLKSTRPSIGLLV